MEVFLLPQCRCCGEYIDVIDNDIDYTEIFEEHGLEESVFYCDKCYH